MAPIRILIISHAPLSPELGAGQVAINLAQALQVQGHQVILWSPPPLPPQTKWWQTLQQMRSEVNAFIATQPPFDIIESPAILITPQLSQAALVVARSVQPELLYLAHSLKDQIELSLKGIIRLPFGYLYCLYAAILVLQGWKLANYLLCLGSLELAWMKKWFSQWDSKFIYYINALSQTDQEALTKVRLQRQPPSGDRIKFLWIGRWTSHKGTDILIDFIVNWLSLRPQDSLTIAGCGPQAENDCPPQLLNSGKLKIIPSFERSKIYTLLADHDVGLFTSRIEGWGLVLNEMLEAGMPVFATSVGAVPDLQPFFPEQLKPFPPSPQDLPNSWSVSISEDYYTLFSWERVAKIYQHSIVPALNLKPQSPLIP